MTGRRGARRVKFLGDTLDESSRTNSRLRGRALVRLGRLHPDQLADLINLERVAAGIPCVGERTNEYVGHLPCGTSAAYTRHIRNGEVPCDACRAARAAESAATRKRQRNRRGDTTPDTTEGT